MGECQRRPFNHFCEFLERQRVAYCVVGQSDSYPDEIRGDVDVVVDRSSYVTVERIVAEFCREARLVPVQLLHHEQTSSYFVLADSRAAGEYLVVDICSDVFRGGRLYVSAEAMLQGRQKNDRGFYVAARSQELLYYLTKKIDKCELDDTAANHLLKQYHLVERTDGIGLQRYWSRSNVELITSALRENDFGMVRAHIAELKRDLLAHLPGKFSHLVREWRRIALRVLKPTGLTVAVLGPDGSGKSSVIEQAVLLLNPAFRRTVLHHFRPALGQGKTANSNDPHAQPPRGVVASLAKVLLYVGDYWAWALVQSIPSRVRSTITVFDRYFYDVEVDPIRYRYGASEAVLRFARKLVLKPDVLIVLTGPAEEFHRRKPEVELGTARKLETAYRDIGTQLGAHFIDAGADLPSVAQSFANVVLTEMAARVNQRHFATRDVLCVR